MPQFIVTDRASGREVYRYTAEEPISWVGFEFGTHDHIAVQMPIELDVVQPHRVSKLMFQELLGDALYLQIKAAAMADPLSASGLWLDKFNMLSTGADGTSVDLNDPRTRSGLEALMGHPGVDIDQATVERVLEGHHGD